jgi:uncharacterized protein (TIGR02453 family)
MKFNGYPKGAVQFLKRLEKNNNREWFQEHKGEYQSLLRKPTEDFIHALRQKIGRELPEFMFEPKKAIFRINRDTRFREDKRPYKNNIAFFIRARTHKKGVDSPGFYFHISPKEVYIGGGQYIPSSPDLLRIRNQIDKDPKALKKILNSAKFKNTFGPMPGETLKRAPKGFDPDHPDIELLKLKQWHNDFNLEPKMIYSPELVDYTAETFLKISPLVYWIMGTIRYKAFL